MQMIGEFLGFVAGCVVCWILDVKVWRKEREARK